MIIDNTDNEIAVVCRGSAYAPGVDGIYCMETQRWMEFAEGREIMKLLLLYGIKCTKEIWDYINPYLCNYVIDYVEYPHEVTMVASKVEDITKWVYDNYHIFEYDAVIGHSLGGIIALQLAAKYRMKTGKILFLDTNLKPAELFYRNLMTQGNLEKYNAEISKMFEKEDLFYHKDLTESLQNDFDYTVYLNDISQKVYGIYGDRGFPCYRNRVSDLNLPEKTSKKIDFRFISNACHMIMIENPKELAEIINSILNE